MRFCYSEAVTIRGLHKNLPMWICYRYVPRWLQMYTKTEPCEISNVIAGLCGIHEKETTSSFNVLFGNNVECIITTSLSLCFKVSLCFFVLPDRYFIFVTISTSDFNTNCLLLL